METMICKRAGLVIAFGRGVLVSVLPHSRMAEPMMNGIYPGSRNWRIRPRGDISSTLPGMYNSFTIPQSRKRIDQIVT